LVELFQTLDPEGEPLTMADEENDGTGVIDRDETKTAAAPDWTCDGCSAINAGDERRCMNCGVWSPAARAVAAARAAAEAAKSGPPPRRPSAPNAAVRILRQTLLLTAIGMIAALVAGGFAGSTTFSPVYHHERAFGWGFMWCAIAVVLGVALVLISEGLVGMPRTDVRLRWARFIGLLGLAGGTALMIVDRTHNVVTTVGWWAPTLIGGCSYGLCLAAVVRARIVQRAVLCLLCLAVGLGIVGSTVSQRNKVGMLSTNPVTQTFSEGIKAIAPPFTRRPVRIWHNHSATQAQP
jgi:hypothetical protein